MIAPCHGGGIGIRARLRSVFPKGIVGSSPTHGTIRLAPHVRDSLMVLVLRHSGHFFVESNCPKSTSPASAGSWREQSLQGSRPLPGTTRVPQLILFFKHLFA